MGRNEEKFQEIAENHDIDRWSTDLDAALAGPDEVYFDSQLTSVREPAITRALKAGKHVYTEKPVADDVEGALRLSRLAREAGVKTGVVQDTLHLPGLLKLRRLVESGFFGRVLSVRVEFGYWVSEGDFQAAQRPSWNYRAEDGGGIATGTTRVPSESSTPPCSRMARTDLTRCCRYPIRPATRSFPP